FALLQGQGRADEEDSRELYRADLQGPGDARRDGPAAARQPAEVLQEPGLHRGRAAGRPALQQRLHQVDLRRAQQGGATPWPMTGRGSTTWSIAASSTSGTQWRSPRRSSRASHTRSRRWDATSSSGAILLAGSNAWKTIARIAA